MRISHKWSHTRTIHLAQSQFSHPHFLTFHLLGSYTLGSAYPFHNSTFSFVTTTRTIHPAQFQILHIVKAIRPSQPHYHTFTSPMFIQFTTCVYFTFQHNSHINVLFSLLAHTQHISITISYSNHNYQFTPFIYPIHT